MKIEIELTDDEWQEIVNNLWIWNDESYALHAAYIFREALKRAGYINE